MTAATDPTGVVTRYVYDGLGNVTSMTKPTDGVFATESDQNDSVTS